uniref:Coenzyme A synthase n=1 Tax=Anas platyrhynchos platyrhynchos TaxID=8840 RepID=A0A493T9T6_ANAPP
MGSCAEVLLCPVGCQWGSSHPKHVPLLPSVFLPPLPRYSAQQMYELVANVGDYRLFVPWCRRSAVLSRRGHVLRAELEVGFPPLHERYLSEVSLGPRQIRAVSSDCRLFRHLETLWSFGPGLPGRTDSCSLDFSVSFEFRSALHSRLAALFLDEVAKQMVAAFEGRARELFGPQAAQRAARRA